MMKDNCIFCMIANGSIPSKTIYENEEFRVFLDVNPATKGHCLIVPKDHYENIYEIDEAVAGRLFSLATRIARALKASLGCEGLNIVQNNGKLAGQTVFHFHLHLIPRYEGDGFDPLWEQHESDGASLEALCELVKAQL